MSKFLRVNNRLSEAVYELTMIAGDMDMVSRDKVIKTHGLLSTLHNYLEEENLDIKHEQLSRVVVYMLTEDTGMLDCRMCPEVIEILQWTYNIAYEDETKTCALKLRALIVMFVEELNSIASQVTTI